MELPAQTHEFDFWLGTWDVFGPEGRQVGTNTITSLFDGRALMEEWAGAGAVQGRSLNSWDDGRQAWHQTWMDSSGSTLLLDGGLRDGSMVMEGTAPSESGAETWDRHRITWDPVRGRSPGAAAVGDLDRRRRQLGRRVRRRVPPGS